MGVVGKGKIGRNLRGCRSVGHNVIVPRMLLDDDCDYTKGPTRSLCSDALDPPSLNPINASNRVS
jgi:hypothetical protein